MDLYKISTAILSLYDSFEAGEIDEQTYADTVESLGVENVIDEHIRMIRNAESNAAKINEEIALLRNKANSEKNKADFAKKMILNCLNTMEKTKADTGIFKVSKCISKAVEVTDQSLLSEKYLKTKPPEPDKKSILDDLKSGVEIKGARLVESDYIRIT